MGKKNPCTPGSVVGGLAGLLEASGIKVDAEAFDVLPVDGQSQFHLTANKVGKELHDESPVDPDEDAAIKDRGNGLNVNVIHKVFIDQRNPSGVLGESLIKPILDFTREFHATNWHRLGQARSEYFKGMKAVVDSIDTSGLSNTQKGYFAEYQNWVLGGGDLYPKAGKTGLTTALGNFAGNYIHSSPHVITGHFIASTLKLASLYPDTMLQGIAKATSKGLFFEVPELKDAGLYGVQHIEAEPQSPLMRSWNGLVNLIDTPVANIFYYAGEARGGVEDGLKAAQRGAFKMRLNDTPRQRWTAEGKNYTGFLNWTINSARLYSSLWADVATKEGTQKLGAVGSLTMFHALPILAAGAYAVSQGKEFLPGGIAAAVPAPAVEALSWISPDAAQSIKDNRTGLSEQLAIRDVNELGLSLELFSKTVLQAPKDIAKGANNFRNGDTQAGFLDMGNAGLSLMKVFKLPGPAGVLNDNTVQHVYNIYRKQVEGTNTEDFGDAMKHYFLPMTAPAK